MRNMASVVSANEEIRLGAGLSKEEAAGLATPDLLDTLLFWYESNEIRVRTASYLAGVAGVQQFLLTGIPYEQMPESLRSIVVLSTENIKALKKQHDDLVAILDGSEMQSVLMTVMDEFARRGEAVHIVRSVKGTRVPETIKIGDTAPVAVISYDLAAMSVEALWRSIEAMGRKQKALSGLGAIPAVVWALVSIVGLMVFYLFKENSLFDKIIQVRAALPEDVANKIMGDYRGIRENTNIFDAVSNVAWIVVGAAAVIGLTMASTAIAPGLLKGLGDWIGNKIGQPITVAAPIPGMTTGASGPAAATFPVGRGLLQPRPRGI